MKNQLVVCQPRPGLASYQKKLALLAAEPGTQLVLPTRAQPTTRIELMADGSAWLTLEWLSEDLAHDAQVQYPALFALHPTTRGTVLMLDEEVASPRWHRSYLHLPARQKEKNYSYMYAGKTGYPSLALPGGFQGFLNFLNAGQGASPYNQIIANWYADGNDRIARHCDCELGMQPGASIAILSLNENEDTRRELIFTAKKANGLCPQVLHRRVVLALPHGLIVTMHGATQTHFRHHVPRSRVASASRISLTFRKF